MQLHPPDQVKHVAIIGAGTVGASWTALFLSRGMSAAVYDPDPDTAQRVERMIKSAWPVLERIGIADAADPTAWRICSDPASAVEGAHFVQESATEKPQVKVDLYKRMQSKLADDVVVASSTSGLLISELQKDCAGPQRYVTGHPFNPPHLIPLVEVVAGRLTDPAAVQWAIDFYNGLGKKAIHIRKEVYGHLANRLQAALLREAFAAVNDGVATVADVDAAVAYGPGLRWAIMGPLLIFHLGGGAGGMAHMLDHMNPLLEGIWKDQTNPHLEPAVNKKLIDGADDEVAGRSIDQLAAERDALLIATLETLSRTRQALDENR